jgi:proteasome lid subunit RPN8/RPN11
MIHVPAGVVLRATEDLATTISLERAAWFGLSHEQEVVWMPSTNVHPEPKGNTEIPADEIATMILDLQITPLALIHSHPSGLLVPSLGDWEDFPSAYVEVCYIWSHKMPDYLCEYRLSGHGTRTVRIDEVYIHAGD